MSRRTHEQTEQAQTLTDLATTLSLASMIGGSLSRYDAASIVASMVDIRIKTGTTPGQLEAALERLMLDKRLHAQVLERWESLVAAWEKIAATGVGGDGVRP